MNVSALTGRVGFSKADCTAVDRFMSYLKSIVANTVETNAIHDRAVSTYPVVALLFDAIQADVQRRAKPKKHNSVLARELPIMSEFDNSTDKSGVVCSSAAADVWKSNVTEDAAHELDRVADGW